MHGGRPSFFQVLHALSLEPLAEALDGHGLAQRLERTGPSARVAFRARETSLSAKRT
ncbi:hypothetical protein ASNO1_03390 [Corallococcus caeni]|uniref:Uncharacterized protein n=1 Tax=Corallococcus caeni TaxID=3082388 RepID=A0ABQ6QJS4_9BACT|nr:hypothetical protein ASNO1_03390 [Corallococcus sp. NO1]